MKQINLVDTFFSKNWNFESGILCTYGLNLNFFENYLMKLPSLYSCENICVFTDSGTYDNFIKESYTPRGFNKKYLVNRLKSGGVFHPKLYMLASEKKALIGVGSANLTREGIISNLELLTVFEVSEKEKEYASLLCDCIDYVRRLAQITRSKSALDQVDVFAQLCSSYIYDVQESKIRFVHNLDQPLIDSITDSMKGSQISKIQVVSPFYDTALAPFEVLRNSFPESKFEIYLQQKKSNFPKDFFEESSLELSLLLYKTVDRYLHGKAIIFNSDDSIKLFSGSANFTRSALLSSPVSGNYEIGLIGKIDEEIASNLLCPSGNKALKVNKLDDVEVNTAGEFTLSGGTVDYIVDAVLKENCITVEINSSISSDEFVPQKFRFLSLNSHLE